LVVVAVVVGGTSDSDGSDDSDDSGSDGVSCSSSGKPVGLLGVWREAVVRTAVISGLVVLVVFGLLESDDEGSSRSLLTQSVQANVSPT
jgi:hypothetical protein